MTDANDPGALTAAAILDEIKTLALDHLELQERQVNAIMPETPLVGGLELDSLGQTILLAEIEDRYGFVFGPIDRDHLQAAETVDDLIQLILSRVQGESA